MRKSLVILLLAASCQLNQVPDTMPELYHPAVAKLNILDDEGLAGHCSIWKTYDGLLVTAGHCCDPEDAGYALEGKMAPPGPQTIKVLVDDDVHDVCVMKGEMYGTPIALGWEPRIGEPVWTAGYPRGWFLVSSGYWSGRDEDGNGVCSVVVAGGASGSPILDAQGYAVGVLVMRVREMDNLTLTTGIEWLRAAVYTAQLIDGGLVRN